MKNLLKRIFYPFGKGSFWVIGLVASLLWLLLYILINRIAPIYDSIGEVIGGSFLGAFGFSYVAQQITYKK